MVGIKDLKMPSCCMNCGLLGKEEMYCSIYPRKDLDVITVATNRPNWCPLVEIEERKVGKWIRKPIRNDKGGCIGAEIICSCCNKDNRHDEYMDYCPNCGADMRGSENE